MPKRMTREEKDLAVSYISQLLNDQLSSSSAMAYGAFQVLGCLFDHEDVYECVDKAERKTGHKIRRPSLR